MRWLACVYHIRLLAAYFPATVTSLTAYSLLRSRVMQHMPQTLGNQSKRSCLVSSLLLLSLQYGERQWNLIQHNTALRRCGKSCRLRWANHLRTDLKRGAFTEEEEAVVVTMHAQIGKKWAKMAAEVRHRYCSLPASLGHQLTTSCAHSVQEASRRFKKL